MNTSMNNSLVRQPQSIAEMCADIVDVLADSITVESLDALTMALLDISGAPAGEAFTTDVANEIDKGISLQRTQVNVVRSSCDSVPYVAQRSLHTLQPEFAVTSNSGQVQYDYAFPLRVRGRSLGAVVLHVINTQLLTEEDISLIQSITDLAASTIDQSHQLQQHRTLATHLQNALNSRVVLEQAKGVLAERSKTDCISAFSELRQLARRSQRPIHQVASEIVASTEIARTTQQTEIRASVA